MTDGERIELSLDHKRCKRYGNCVAILPEAFQLERGVKTVTLVEAELPSERQEAVRKAIGACPARAISMRMR